VDPMRAGRNSRTRSSAVRAALSSSRNPRQAWRALVGRASWPPNGLRRVVQQGEGVHRAQPWRLGGGEASVTGMTASSEFKTLRVDRRLDRMVVTLYRPTARNALNLAMSRELNEICSELERDPCPLIIRGSNGIFAAGADITELKTRTASQAFKAVNLRLFDRVAHLPQPTLAAVDGLALGGGAELAYACDIRIASDAGAFANPEPTLGILAGAGGCWRLAELTNKSIARQVLLGGRRLNASEALGCGLVGEVAPGAELDHRAHAWIDRILAQSSAAVRLTKLVLGADAAHPVADLLAQALLLDRPDKIQRMNDFLERRRQ
jgi:enoyl-CoA hydratase